MRRGTAGQQLGEIAMDAYLQRMPRLKIRRGEDARVSFREPLMKNANGFAVAALAGLYRPRVRRRRPHRRWATAAGGAATPSRPVARRIASPMRRSVGRGAVMRRQVLRSSGSAYSSATAPNQANLPSDKPRVGRSADTLGRRRRKPCEPASPARSDSRPRSAPPLLRDGLGGYQGRVAPSHRSAVIAMEPI